MIRRVAMLSLLAGGTALSIAGCQHKCCRSDGGPGPIRPLFSPPPGSTIPPTSVPIIPGNPVPGNTGSLPPPAFPPGSSSNRPAQELLLPDPLAPGGGTSSSKPAGGILGGPVKAGTNEPPVAAKPEAVATAGSPAGLAGFTQIKDGLAAGRKPAREGFDTLKNEGYKTAVFIHAPGADVAAVRELAQTAGIAFVAIESTPEKLGEAYEQLSKAVAEKSARPAYVFDDDGSRAAPLWYLHFKTVDLESNDVAKIRAKALGLADNSEFWPAIKQQLSK